MASPTLEPYRDEILSLLRKGQNKAEIWRHLERQRGVKIGRTQFYAFVDQLIGDASPGIEEEPFRPLHEVGTPDLASANEAVQAFLIELPRALEEFSTRLTQLEQRNETAEQRTLSALREFQETLSTLPQQSQSRASQTPHASPATATKSIPTRNAPVAAAALRQIWKRAFVVSGVVWGMVELLLVQGYWRPLWAAIVK